MSVKSVRQQFADTMFEVGALDEKLVVVVGDISHGILQPFAKKYIDRYYNIGICEPAMMSLGAGLSKSGLTPVIHTIAPFILERSFEQLKLDFCYQQISGNIVTVGSAFDYANLGSTHHCYSDFALIKALPFAAGYVPGSALEFDVLFKSTYKNFALNIFRIPNFPHEIELDPKDVIPGKGIKVIEGSDITLIAVGAQLSSAFGAREKLLTKGISAEIIYLPTVQPMDTNLIKSSLQKTKLAVVVEEHMENGGVNEDVMRIALDIGECLIESVSIPNQFLTLYGSYHEHCEEFGLTADGVATRAELALRRSKIRKA